MSSTGPTQFRPRNGEEERLLVACRVLGLTTDQAEAAMKKHSITIRGLYEALAKGWTPDSPVHPLDYELPKFDPARLAEAVRQFNEIAQEFESGPQEGKQTP